MVELTLAHPGPDNKITMLRVLMVLEDYGELMFLQTVLKKIGFDVDSTQNPRKFNDSLLAMNPDILLMTAAGKRIRGVELSTQVRKQRGLPKIILIRTGGFSQDSVKDAEIDGWLESPVAAPDLLDKIAELCHLNKQILQDKLLKLRMSETSEEQARVLKLEGEEHGGTLDKSVQSSGNFGTLKASTMSSNERQSRYNQFLKDNDAPPSAGFGFKDVQEQVKALRKEESQSNLEDLERERRAFVEHLFKKKTS